MAHYTFLPWQRRGAVRLAAAATEKERLTVPLRLHVIGEGEAPVVIERSARLYGPGDVTGIDTRAIVRTIPHAGVRDFEANFLAGIEFYDEDFPWRYTPALPDGGRLTPWIWLTVLEETEYRRLPVGKGQLPAIEITAAALGSAFPDAATTVSWAHVHLNFKPEGAHVEAVQADIQQKLDEDPNLGCSRLLCPRRLRPQCRYHAFLLPAFEKGRLAGLGHASSAIDAAANTQAAWPMGSSGGSALAFPVYFEWAFTTASAGDFEDLARQLAPLSPEETAALAGAAQLLDVRDPGWGLKGAAGAVRLESALQLPVALPPLTGEAADQQLLRERLAPLLNLGVQPLDPVSGQNPNPYFTDDKKPGARARLEDDPIVVPPLYGAFYRPGEALRPDRSPDWYPQLNLNPVYRLSAAQGTGVVQQYQEEYVDRAWDQWSAYVDIRQVSRRWSFSLQLSEALFAKRIDPLLRLAGADTPAQQETRQYQAVGFFAPMLGAVAHQTAENRVQSAVATLQQARWPSTHSPAFTKVTRTGGPLMRRVAEQSPGTSFFLVPVAISAFIPEPPLKKAVQTALTYLLHHAEADDALRRRGLGGVQAATTALTAWTPYLGTAPQPPPKHLQAHLQVFEAIKAQVRPALTITARFEGMVRNTYPELADPTAPPTEAPIFPEAMYQALAARSKDFILPGLERIPLNRVAILAPNQAFIEAYLVGLNHEMARELLWREFPAPLDATYFRQFWDVRNASTPRQDILAIGSWGPTALGTHRPPPAGDPLVVVIRGDLLRKYPHTEVFMVKAEADPSRPGGHRLTLDPDKPEDWVNPTPALLRRPVFSARIDPDYLFLGFQLSIGEVRPEPGWFFVLKERAGDVQFGLDIAGATATDPSWEALGEVSENQCINTASARFAALPRAGQRADQVAAMLLQRPFMLFVHGQRLLP